MRAFGILLLLVSGGVGLLGIRDALFLPGVTAEWVLGCLAVGIFGVPLGGVIATFAGRATYHAPRVLQGNSHPECSGGGFLDRGREPNLRICDNGTTPITAVADHAPAVRPGHTGAEHEREPGHIPAPERFTAAPMPGRIEVQVAEDGRWISIKD